MLKMALFDRAINENRLQCLRGICPLFSSPSRANRQLKSSPHLREFAIQGKKKNANTRGSARGGAGGRGAGRRWNWLMRYEGNKMKRKREWSSLQRFSQTVYIPKGLVHSFPAESIEITIINAVYSNINFKLSLSVFLPFPRTSFGEISEIRRRVCFKFYARILRKYNQKMKLKSMRFYPWW